MKNILIWVLASLLSFSFVFAAPVAPSNIQLVSSTNNSITFSWDEVSDTLGYYLYWGIDSVNENEEVTPIEETEFTLTDLQENTKYKIALTTINSSGEESQLSTTQTFSTSGASEDDDFQLLEVQVIDETTLELSFNSPLEDSQDAQREFMILTATSGKEINISDTELNSQDSSLLTVTLSEPLTTSTSYDVTVLAVKDTNGKTIENGIDAVTNFTTPLTFEIELNSAWPEEPALVPEVDTTENTSVTPVSVTGWPGGQIVTPEETEKHTIVAAKQNDNLPQTWPEHIILFILSLLAGFIYFFFMRNQKAV